MKKTVVVCILVAVLACMWSSVAFASYDNPAQAYWSEWKMVGGTYDGQVMWAEADYPHTVDGYLTNGYIGTYTGVPQQGGVVAYFYDDELNSLGDSLTEYRRSIDGGGGVYQLVRANHTVYMHGTQTVVMPSAPPFGDAEVVITSPIDLYQDNAIRWKFRSVLAINDVEGGFDTSKLSYILEFYAGQLYAQAELVSVTYWEVQDELYILTEEDRVVNMKTFEFEPPASRGKARVICLYDNEVIATAEVRYHRYSGFVDEDGDDLDDRTGLPDHSKGTVYEPEVEMPQRPEDGDLLAWLEYIGELFGYVFEVIISVLKDFAEVVVECLRVILEIVEPMFSFVEQFFASLPAPMSAAMIALVTLSAVLGILKLLRG